ncbi:MAG: hypothetical protein SVZ03_09100 [Spirochaetota bacterium]|nr:hypothetical protein [Spirochaetota bacterium]
MIFGCASSDCIEIVSDRSTVNPLRLRLVIYKCFFLFIIILLYNVEGFSLDANSRVPYLRDGWAGARYVAMGKSAEVIVDDVYSIYWNPAGLSDLKILNPVASEEIKGDSERGNLDEIGDEDLIRFSNDKVSESFYQVGLSAAFIDIESGVGFGGVAFDLFSGVMGVGLYSIQTRNIEVRDEEGNLIGKTDFSGSACYISYGWIIGVSSLGFSIKGLYENIGDYGFYGGGVDVGYQVEIIPFLRIGFLVQDIGTGLKPAEEYENIENKYDFASPVLKLSAAFTSPSWDFIIALTGIKNIEQQDYEFNLGFQYDIVKYSSLYFGLNDSVFSTGISFRFFQLDFAYAFTYEDIIGYTNIVSLTFLL